jgi:adenylate cyclase
VADDRVERRLAAILAADVAGYSRLMGIDEVGTLAALKAARRDVVDPAIAEYKGRIVKTTGDGMLVEFASAVDAVDCAVAVQAKMAERNGSAIRFRVGINIGDIIIDSGDIFGDGVNVAARVENECEPGSVCLSGSAFEHVRGKTRVTFRDLGERALKNIDRPVRLYAVRLPADLEPAVARPSAEAPRLPALPDRPSIAVLPFTNMSGDPEQEYFADGIVEDIITALSRFKSLFVIARNSSFTYKGKAVDIKHVGRELGVRYVLEGSVRKASGRLRITGQLIEAATNNHLWADKFDGAIEDIFDLQDQVTTSVVGLLAPAIEQVEIERAKRKPTERLDAYDVYLRGEALLRNGGSSRAAAKLFTEATQKDSEYGAAYAMIAWTILRRQAATGVSLPPELREEAVRLATTAEKLANGDAFVLARAGHVFAYVARQYDRGLSLTADAVALNPNMATAWYSRGWVALLSAEPALALESFDRMLRLSPLDPLRGTAWNGKAFALFCLDRFAEGQEAAARALQVFKDVHTLGALILNQVGAGRIEEARETVTDLLQLQPGFCASSSIEAFPVRSSAIRDRMVKSLQKAGVPQ